MTQVRYIQGLARAERWHLERAMIITGAKTIVFT